MPLLSVFTVVGLSNPQAPAGVADAVKVTASPTTGPPPVDTWAVSASVVVPSAGTEALAEVNAITFPWVMATVPLPLWLLSVTVNVHTPLAVPAE